MLNYSPYYKIPISRVFPATWYGRRYSARQGRTRRLLLPGSHRHQTTTNLSAAISSAASISQLKQIHAQILRHHLHRSDPLLFHLLLSSLPFPSGGLQYALAVFSAVEYPEPRLYNKLIRELSRSKRSEVILQVFELIAFKGLAIDRFIFPPLLKAAGKCSALYEGRCIHGLASKLGLESDPFVGTALVGMYASCKEIQNARMVFDKMSHRDVVSWTIMIDGYCQDGRLDDVLVLMEEMSSNVRLDSRVFSPVFSACAKTKNLEVGKAFHELLLENGIEIDSHLQSSLVNMYASCGSMDEAQRLYDELSQANVVGSTAMVRGYSNTGCMESARAIFDKIVRKDLICWSTMIAGYAKSAQPQEALNLFDEMQESGFNPDEVTMLSCISACANLGSLDKARQIHRYAVQNGFGEALRVNNALIGMYNKCRSLEDARKVFVKMRKKNAISWTSMINAFGNHRKASEALNLFYQMRNEDAQIQPNSVTFVGILYACSRAGLVEEGQKIFKIMVEEFGISPKLEHYGCMVDLYARANLLIEAFKLVETMPLVPNVVIWGSLMDACWIHGQSELGQFVAKKILELDPNHGGALMFLSSIRRTETDENMSKNEKI